MLAHGEIQLSWTGNVLTLHIEGLFNEEGALAELSKCQAAVLESGKTCWGQLEIWGTEVLGTPEAFAHVADDYRWCVAHGCRAVAIVTSNSMQEWVARSMVAAPFAMFTDKAEALVWLERQINAECPLDNADCLSA